MKQTTKTVAIMGIDGSGKTTLIRHFSDHQHWPLALSFFCPDYHLSNLAPMGQLSQDAAKLSVLADRLEHLPLKLLALYLKMSLFHSVQSFFAQSYSPEFLLSERNPLIDVLAYGKFYGQVSEREPKKKGADQLIALLEQELPHELHRLKKWVDVINHRTNKKLSLIEYPIFCLETLKKGTAHTLQTFGLEFQSNFPHFVVFLDITPQAAAHRLQQAKALTELHESLAALSILNQAYQEVLKSLPQLGASTRVFHLSAELPEQEMADRLLQYLKSHSSEATHV